jgi:hypothetical protein
VPAAAGDLAQHRHDLRLLWDGDSGDARLEDAGLLAGDLVERAAQDLRVLELDGGDRRDLGDYHVGGVGSPAHADLDDRDVHRQIGEVEKGNGGQDFEVGRFAQLLRDVGLG